MNRPKVGSARSILNPAQSAQVVPMQISLRYCMLLREHAAQGSPYGSSHTGDLSRTGDTCNTGL